MAGRRTVFRVQLDEREDGRDYDASVGARGRARGERGGDEDGVERDAGDARGGRRDAGVGLAAARGVDRGGGAIRR